jgi:hypothetical protein
MFICLRLRRSHVHAPMPVAYATSRPFVRNVRSGTCSYYNNGSKFGCDSKEASGAYLFRPINQTTVSALADPEDGCALPPAPTSSLNQTTVSLSRPSFSHSLTQSLNQSDDSICVGSP